MIRACQVVKTFTPVRSVQLSRLSSEVILTRSMQDAVANPTSMMPSTIPTKKLRKVTKTIVTTPEIYKPVGPYSQAILAGNTLYISGVLGMDRQGQMVNGGAEAQTRQILQNMKYVLEAGGASLESVIKTTILLANMDDFAGVNRVYAEFFPNDAPARMTYQVAKLPKDAAVEIDAIALSGDLVIEALGPCPCTD